MAITKLLKIGENTGHGNIHAHLKNCIFYICNPDKTDNGFLIGGNAGLDPEVIYETMLFNKEIWGKRDMRQGYHYILSFSPEDDVSAELAYTIGNEFAETLLGEERYYVTAVHTDKDHMHVHLVFDSVSKNDGRKYQSPPGDWERRIQPIVDNLCEKYHVSTLIYDKDGDRKGKNYGEWRKEHQKKHSENQEPYTAYDVIRDDIDEAIQNSETYEEFLAALKNMQYEITRDQKYLSVKPHFRQKAVRTGRLGSGYGKESIQLRIMAEKEKDTIFSHYKHYGDMKEIKSLLFVRVQKVKGWKMSDFQRAYYRRLYRIFHIRRPHYYNQSWKYKQDILQVKKISRCNMMIIKEDLRSLDAVNEKQTELQKTLDVATAKSRALKTQLYQGEFYKAVRDYRKALDAGDEQTDTLNRCIHIINKTCPVDQALQKLDMLQEEIRETGIAIRDIKKELKTLDEIRVLYYQPEHNQAAEISDIARHEIKTLFPKKKKTEKRKNDKGVFRLWKKEQSQYGTQKR